MFLCSMFVRGIERVDIKSDDKMVIFKKKLPLKNTSDLSNLLYKFFSTNELCHKIHIIGNIRVRRKYLMHLK